MYHKRFFLLAAIPVLLLAMYKETICMEATAWLRISGWSHFIGRGSSSSSSSSSSSVSRFRQRFFSQPAYQSSIATTPSMNHPYHRIFLFGDSITQFSFDPELSGFGAALANSYQRRMDVMNRGFSGYNTKWALPILKQLLPTVEQQKQHASKVQLMTIFFGANDAALPFSRQHIPLEQYKDNLRAMISMVQSPDSPYYNPTLRLILITPPPLDEAQWEKNCDNGVLNRTFDSAKQYAAAVREVANECNVVVADIWTAMVEDSGDSTHYGEYLIDGLHLSAKGNQAVYQLLMKQIKEHFSDIHPENLGMDIPWWRNLTEDYENETQFPLLK